LKELTITTENKGGTVYLSAKGRINTTTAPELEQALDKALNTGQPNIVLDMCYVDFLSSNGIRAILKTYKQATKMGGTFKIANPSGNVKNVLGMAALEPMLLK